MTASSLGPIEKYMTASPHTINAEQNLKFASELMKDINVRHLPVLKAGELIGILSDRDIRFIESFEHLDPSKIYVEEACTEDPYSVQEEAPTEDVCKEMRDKKIGSVLIKSGHKLVGIFTWIDALDILSKR